MALRAAGALGSRHCLPSRAKDDTKDAEYLADLLLTHHAKLPVWAPEDSATRAVQQLVGHRRAVVDERTGLSNRLIALLKQYYPQALTLCGEDLWRPLATAFLLNTELTTSSTGTFPPRRAGVTPPHHVHPSSEDQSGAAGAASVEFAVAPNDRGGGVDLQLTVEREGGQGQRENGGQETILQSISNDGRFDCHAALNGISIGRIDRAPSSNV